jgi:hypothetical protein
MTFQRAFCDTDRSLYLDMKKVSILVPESSVPQAIADPQYLFTAVEID